MEYRSFVQKKLNKVQLFPLLITRDQWLQMQGLAPEEPAEENPPVEEEIP